MNMSKTDLADATITQLLIPIDDFERGVVFYRDVLGLPFLFAAPPQMAFFQAELFGCSWVLLRQVRRCSAVRKSISE